MYWHYPYCFKLKVVRGPAYQETAPSQKEGYKEKQQLSADSGTKVVMIGTGTPEIDPDRSGPATAIVVNGAPYIIDMGPGIVRRAKSASIVNNIPALDPVKIKVVFVTHSCIPDHTVGFPDLIFTPWTIGRRFPLEVYGPKRDYRHDQ